MMDEKDGLVSYHKCYLYAVCLSILRLFFWLLRTSLNFCCFSLKNSFFFFLTSNFTNRRQKEAELRILEEETARRIEEAIRKKVEESLNSEEIKLEIQRRIEEGHKKLLDEVAAQLEKEKEAALIEARQKVVWFLYKRTSIMSFLFFTMLYIEITSCPIL